MSRGLRLKREARPMKVIASDRYHYPISLRDFSPIAATEMKATSIVEPAGSFDRADTRRCHQRADH